MNPCRSLMGLLIWCCVYECVVADDFESLRVQRKEVFEFSKEPSVVRDGDRLTIRFTSKDYCDATIAIENQQGRIIRHLASGVLGKNAPDPLQKSSLQQVVVWDGKDDQGQYVEQLDDVTVRVSLGLKPRFERTMLWSPHRRFGGMPLLASGPEGVYVYDGRGVDFLRLYDHEGDYIRSQYPFPRSMIRKVEGLNWYDFPQGYRLPRKGGLYQLTLLSSGVNYHSGNHAVGRNGAAADSMCLRGDRLTLAGVQINRLNTDGGTGGLQLGGPTVGHVIKSVAGEVDVSVGPSSIALSPDDKTLYATAYLWRTGSWREVPGCYHVVYKIDYESNELPTIFKGDLKQHGTDNSHFQVPTSVATDSTGRVYVSDFFNDRIQVYNAAGEHIRTIKTTKPAKVCVHQHTGERMRVQTRCMTRCPIPVNEFENRFTCNVNRCVTLESSVRVPTRNGTNFTPVTPVDSSLRTADFLTVLTTVSTDANILFAGAVNGGSLTDSLDSLAIGRVVQVPMLAP